MEQGYKEVISGIDWGWSNPSVLLVILINGDDEYFVVEEIYQRHLDIDEFIRMAKDLQMKWGISKFFCDPSEPQYIHQFNSAGLNAIPGENALIPGINKVASKLQIKGNGRPSLFIHPRCVNLISEFESYRYPDKREAGSDRDIPLKAFDHALDSLRYALFTKEPRMGIIDRNLW